MSTRCSHWPGNRSGTRDDHGSAARSTCGVVRNLAVADFTFNAQVHVHCWKEHTIAEIKSCYTTRSKKCVELCIGHHYFSRRLSVFGIAALNCAFIGTEITRNDRRITSDHIWGTFGDHMTSLKAVDAIRD